jgi:hypothetical protein
LEKISKKTAEQDSKIARLKKENSELKKRLGQ